MIRAGLVAALLCGGSTLAAQTVVVRDAGPGPTGRYLTDVVARPDTRVVVADTVVIPADSIYGGSVVVIGRQATVAGTVRGDLVIVGGSIFLHPGAQVNGRVVAIGGAVYPSLLAHTGGEESHRDFTFDATTVGGVIEMRYRELRASIPGSFLDLPGVSGFRMPTYDRSNGLSLPYGPTLSPSASLTLDPVVTYRSEIGRLDPTLSAEWRLSRKFWLSGFAGRETRSNDRWITGDLSNSLNALFSGRDVRNWYRATGGELFANRLFENTAITSTYRIGGRFERALSARPDSSPTVGPWSFRGRHDREGMFRPNPPIEGGDITSIVGGASYTWAQSRFRATLDVTGEVPTSVSTGQHFTQLTVDGQFGFPTFGSQRYRLDAHAILTRGDTAPGQRFGYLGGPGTISTIEPALSIGGDELLFLENRYEIPLTMIRLPFAGSPTVTLRHLLGSAGIQTLPSLRQLIGFRLSLSLVRFEMMHDTKTGQTETNFSLSLVR